MIKWLLNVCQLAFMGGASVVILDIIYERGVFSDWEIFVFALGGVIWIARAIVDMVESKNEKEVEHD